MTADPERCGGNHHWTNGGECAHCGLNPGDEADRLRSELAEAERDRNDALNLLREYRAEFDSMIRGFTPGPDWPAYQRNCLDMFLARSKEKGP